VIPAQPTTSTFNLRHTLQTPKDRVV
jgi:hypothetical protein